MVVVEIDLSEYDEKRSRISLILWTLNKLEDGGIKARAWFGGTHTYGNFYPIEPGTLARQFLTDRLVRFTFAAAETKGVKPLEFEPETAPKRPVAVPDEAKREATVQALATYLAQSEARKYRLSPEQTQQAYQRHLDHMQRRAS
jgi:hypothetical protein